MFVYLVRTVTIRYVFIYYYYFCFVLDSLIYLTYFCWGKMRSFKSEHETERGLKLITPRSFKSRRAVGRGGGDPFHSLRSAGRYCVHVDSGARHAGTAERQLRTATPTKNCLHRTQKDGCNISNLVDPSLVIDGSRYSWTPPT